jgi:predicted HTH domain antitoxin
VQLPDSLLLQSGRSLADLEKRSQFLLALKYFELGELSSGQAAKMCGMNRAAFLSESSRLGVPVADLSPDEMNDEFPNA